MSYSADYYRLLARTLNIYGFEKSRDVVEFEPVSDQRVRVRVRSGGAGGPVRFERLIDAGDTREVNLFIEEVETRLSETTVYHSS